MCWNIARASVILLLGLKEQGEFPKEARKEEKGITVIPKRPDTLFFFRCW